VQQNHELPSGHNRGKPNVAIAWNRTKIEIRDFTKIESLDFGTIGKSPRSKIGRSLKSKIDRQPQLAKIVMSPKSKIWISGKYGSHQNRKLAAH
jgi:hypothetical protein